MTFDRGWISIFGSGRVSEKEMGYQQGVMLGRLLAGAGFGVCTGGYGGIMEAAVRGARSAGGDTAGVIIGTARSKPNEWVQTLYEEPTWSERLMKLITIGSGYVVMDGGVGTLNEFLMVWEMANKNLHKKPIILLGELVKQCVQDLKKNQWVEGVDKPALAESPKHVIELLNEAL